MGTWFAASTGRVPCGAGVGPVRRRATSAPSHRADEPPGPQALGLQAGLVHTPHRSHGLFRARCANAMSRCLCALPFASSRRSLTRTLGHSQWPKPPRFVHATAPAKSEPRGPSQLRGVRGVSTHRTVPITNRHDSSWFESFRSHFALFWSFWLAISEPGWNSRKKCPTWNPA